MSVAGTPNTTPIPESPSRSNVSPSDDNETPSRSKRFHPCQIELRPRENDYSRRISGRFPSEQISSGSNECASEPNVIRFTPARSASAQMNICCEQTNVRLAETRLHLGR